MCLNTSAPIGRAENKHHLRTDDGETAENANAGGVAGDAETA